jgi:hypothetical protein
MKNKIESMEKAIAAKHNSAITTASGGIVRTDRMVSFFYELMRGYMTPGVVEQIVRSVLAEDAEVCYCNGWLAMYAEYIVKRLREAEEEPKNDGEISAGKDS